MDIVVSPSVVARRCRKSTIFVREIVDELQHRHASLQVVTLNRDCFVHKQVNDLAVRDLLVVVWINDFEQTLDLCLLFMAGENTASRLDRAE